MHYLNSYLLDVGFKDILGLDPLILGEPLMEVDVTYITVVVVKGCCYMEDLLGRSDLYLRNETQSG